MARKEKGPEDGAPVELSEKEFKARLEAVKKYALTGIDELTDTLETVEQLEKQIVRAKGMGRRVIFYKLPDGSLSIKSEQKPGLGATFKPAIQGK